MCSIFILETYRVIQNLAQLVRAFSYLFIYFICYCSFVWPEERRYEIHLYLSERWNSQSQRRQFGMWNKKAILLNDSHSRRNWQCTCAWQLQAFNSKPKFFFPNWWIKWLKDQVQNSVVNNTLGIANNWLIIREDDSVHWKKLSKRYSLFANKSAKWFLFRGGKGLAPNILETIMFRLTMCQLRILFICSLVTWFL